MTWCETFIRPLLAAVKAALAESVLAAHHLEREAAWLAAAGAAAAGAAATAGTEGAAAGAAEAGGGGEGDDNDVASASAAAVAVDHARRWSDAMLTATGKDGEEGEEVDSPVLAMSPHVRAPAEAMAAAAAAVAATTSAATSTTAAAAAAAATAASSAAAAPVCLPMAGVDAAAATTAAAAAAAASAAASSTFDAATSVLAASAATTISLSSFCASRGQVITTTCPSGTGAHLPRFPFHMTNCLKLNIFGPLLNNFNSRFLSKKRPHHAKQGQLQALCHTLTND